MRFSLLWRKPSLALPLAVAAAVLAQCSAPVTMRHVKAKPPSMVSAAPADPAALLDGIRVSHDRIRSGDESAVPAYNYQVARLVDAIERSGADPWKSPVALGSYQLKGLCPPGCDPHGSHLFPTDSYRFRGEYGDIPSKVEGIGAPVVEGNSFDKIGHFQFRGKLPVRNLTALVRFSGNTATLELLDPYQVERVAIGGRERRMAADYGAGMMLALSKARVDKLGLARLLWPSRYNDTANLNFVQPYDPKRIPVLFVHGLDSTPATFAPTYFKLLQDPEIRARYQFWVFSYPSGYPYPYSASLLRRELDEVKREFPGHKPMVIVGHSMGCLISRLMVTDAGDRIWVSAFGYKPTQNHVTGHSRKLLEQTLVFNDRKEIERAVFFSGPHRGSVLATNWVGRTASRLVRTPGLIADIRNAAISTATADVAGLVMNSAPNSIGTLSPDNAFVREINKVPIVSRVPYHSVMGDRGKGDTPDSSDGVVAYWSSHLDGAVSEKIVPSGHASHQHPEGIEELRRILKLHLKSGP